MTSEMAGQRMSFRVTDFLTTHRSKAEAVADAIESTIVTQNLSSGTSLGTKSDLRAATDVAPSTLNEALKLLQSRGRVTLRQGPGGGVFVTDPPNVIRLGESTITLTRSSDDVANAIRIRAMLDRAVVDEIASRVGDLDFSEARSHLEAMGRCVDGADPGDFFSANMEFHAALARLVENPVLDVIYESLVNMIRGRTGSDEQLTVSTPRRRVAQRYRCHEALLEALVERDGALIEKAWSEHELGRPQVGVDHSDPDATL